MERYFRKTLFAVLGNRFLVTVYAVLQNQENKPFVTVNRKGRGEHAKNAEKYGTIEKLIMDSGKEL